MLGTRDAECRKAAGLLIRLPSCVELTLWPARRAFRGGIPCPSTRGNRPPTDARP